MTQIQINNSVKKLFWLCWFAYCMSYIGRLNFSACMADIIADTGITKAFAGTIGTGFLASYGSGQFINGLIGDKISPKYMVCTGLFAAGIANVTMGLSSEPYLMLVIWCINGYSHSMLWSPIIRSFSEWLPSDRQQKAGVNLSTTIPTGTILSYLISSVFLRYASWRMVFIASGFILLSSSVIWFIGIASIKDYISKIGLFKQENEKKLNLKTKTNYLDKNIKFIPLIFKTGLIFTVIGILFNGILKDGVTMWVPTYVSEFFKKDSSTASALTSILPVVNLGGAYFALWLNKNHVKNEMATSAIMFMISGFAFICLILFGHLSVITAVLFIAISTSSMLGVNSMFLTFIPFHFGVIGKSATVTGFLNAFSYMASALSSVTIGVIAESSGWSTTIFSWLLVSAMGMGICVVGKFFWGKGKKMLEEM